MPTPNLMVAVQNFVLGFHRGRHLLATVAAAPVGNTVTVKVDGESTARGQSYQMASAAVTAGLVVGNRVCMIDFSGNGGFIVMDKVP